MKKKLLSLLLFLVVLTFCFPTETQSKEFTETDVPNNYQVKKEKIRFSPEWLSAIASIVSSVSTILIIIQIRKSNKDKIEDRLFRLIELHKKNVDDLIIVDTEAKSGQEIIMKLCNEINYIIRIIDKNNNLVLDFIRVRLN